jgi:hypothetical protein
MMHRLKTPQQLELLCFLPHFLPATLCRVCQLPTAHLYLEHTDQAHAPLAHAFFA